MMLHPLSDVKSSNIGVNTLIWQFVVVLEGARIGANCNICSHVFIENDVVIGNGVTVKNGVFIYDGVRIGDGVFIGPNVTFTNDRYPSGDRQNAERKSNLLETVICSGASIGAGCVILPGIHIGEGAMIGAGSVVTKDVASKEVVLGNPARANLL